MTVLANTWRTLRSNFDPLRLPNFRLYLGGQAISLVGTWLQVTAQAWVVWQLTGSAAALGIVSMLNALPLLFFGLYAGVWVDRVDRRRLLVGTQVSAMLLAFTLAVLIQTHVVQLWHVYLLSFLLGIVNALDLPAQQTFLGELSGMAEVRKAVNMNITILQISRIIGPALAGLIVARIGIAPAFWLNGLSFLAVIASLLVVRASQHIQESRSDVSPLRQIGDGFSFLKTCPRLQDLFIFAVLLTFFFFSVMNIMAAVADKQLGGNAITLGLLLSSSGVGALIAVLVIVPITQSLKHSGPVLLGAARGVVLAGGLAERPGAFTFAAAFHAGAVPGQHGRADCLDHGDGTGAGDVAAGYARTLDWPVHDDQLRDGAAGCLLDRAGGPGLWGRNGDPAERHPAGGGRDSYGVFPTGALDLPIWQVRSRPGIIRR